MNKAIYNYTDWYEGRVYLNTCAIIIPKNKNDKPTAAVLTDFSPRHRKMIEIKQKEIFNAKSINQLKKFKDTFNERFKNSKAKDLFLKQEIEDNRKMLYLTPIQDLSFKNRNFQINKSDLLIIREYINNQLVKGEEYHGFVHSPNFKFQYEKFTNDLVYARVTFDYYNWLIKFSKSRIKSEDNSKNKIKKSIPNEDLKTEKLSVKVIALICFYNNLQITRDNCDEIAAKYGYTAKTSGEGLYQDYSKFVENMYRTKIANESKVKCINRLKLIEDTIKHLDDTKKGDAEKDYKILEKAINEHDW